MAGASDDPFDEVVEVEEDKDPKPPKKNKFKIIYKPPVDVTIDPDMKSFYETQGLPIPRRKEYPQMIHYISDDEESTIESDFFDKLPNSQDLIKSPSKFKSHGVLAASSPIREKQKSLMEWFDESVEEELKKRLNEAYYSLDLEGTQGTGNQYFEESTVDEQDLLDALQGDVPTDLGNAVNSLAKAQALISFEGAVNAAEQAAANAAPEHAEEAAVAGAKGYQAELTSVIKQKVPGLKPVEVLGYVGITRPKGRSRKYY